ncbi:Glycosyltransferase like family protein [Chitinophaga sp. YR573]|uniref:glycosyltransferase n=1 Tax=Chitinophaga sp. YR573 TaxID=1881040 RepID=UPI0008D6C5C2|nr:glycosyltransferase [Chitinophaga sp. YR573]SEW44698.1 Glycosyltransferase like family protein [Chitinophaga sp. YR573]
MVSVIICSANKNRLALVKQNIADTIGANYELIVMEDAASTGICDAYNRAAEKALYEVLCFVHDDVAFQTPNWGKLLSDHFERDEKLGLLGLAGSRYKSKTLSGWWTGIRAADCCNILQRKRNGDHRRFLARPEGLTGDAVPVRTLDGVMLVMRKKVWKEIPFNSEKLKGFHFYDLDLSLRVSEKYTAAVIYNVDLVHFSMGHFSDQWIKAAVYFHKEVSPVTLPCSIEELPGNNEQSVSKSWLSRLRREKISFKVKMLWCRESGSWQFPANRPYVIRFLAAFNALLRHFLFLSIHSLILALHLPILLSATTGMYTVPQII